MADENQNDDPGSKGADGTGSRPGREHAGTTRPDADALRSAAQKAVEGEAGAAAVSGGPTGESPAKKAPAKKAPAKKAPAKKAPAAGLGAAAAAGATAGGSSGSGEEPPTLPPAEGDDEGRSPLIPILGVAAAVLLIVGLVVFLTSGGGGSASDDDAIQTGNRVTLPNGDTVPETTQAPETTEVPQTTEAPETTEVPQTTEAPDTTDVPQTTEAPETTTTTVPPTPAELTVRIAGAVGDSVILRPGSETVVVIQNLGGTEGNYTVRTTGDMSLVDSGTGTVPPGGGVNVRVRASSTPGPEAPQGTITVSDRDGVIISVDVSIQ